jgi:hypothetical protein
MQQQQKALLLSAINVTELYKTGRGAVTER